MGKLEDWLAKQFLKTKQGQAVQGYAQPIVNGAVTNPSGFVKGQLPVTAPIDPIIPVPKGPVIIQVGGGQPVQAPVAPAANETTASRGSMQTNNWIAPVAIGLGAIVVIGGLIYALK